MAHDPPHPPRSGPPYAGRSADGAAVTDGQRLLIALPCWAAGALAAAVVEGIWRELPHLAIGLGMVVAATWGVALLIMLAPDDWTKP